jgi:hypothetical protein
MPSKGYFTGVGRLQCHRKEAADIGFVIDNQKTQFFPILHAGCRFVCMVDGCRNHF